MNTGSLLFDAVITSTTLDGVSEDESAVAAFTDWLQEQDLTATLYVQSDPAFEFYLTIERTFETYTAHLTGRTVSETIAALDHLGPGGGFGEWLVRTIGFDYHLDGK